jgi:pimeloyl-ACP methyl ester carboxylesterase
MSVATRRTHFAFTYAAVYPQEVEKLALMDAVLPGVGGWEPVYNNPGIWKNARTKPSPPSCASFNKAANCLPERS